MKINENLVLDSSKSYDNKLYPICTCKLSEEIKLNEYYTVSFEGEIIPENHLLIHTNNGSLGIGIAINLKSKGNRKYYTFKINENEYSKNAKKDNLMFYNYPNNEAISSKIKNIKLEKGTEMTPYVPNIADVKNNSLYPTKVGGGYLGGNTTNITSTRRWLYAS